MHLRSGKATAALRSGKAIQKKKAVTRKPLKIPNMPPVIRASTIPPGCSPQTTAKTSTAVKTTTIPANWIPLPGKTMRMWTVPPPWVLSIIREQKRAARLARLAACPPKVPRMGSRQSTRVKKPIVLLIVKH